MFLKACKDILAFMIIYSVKALSPSEMKTCVHVFNELLLSYSGGEGWWWKTKMHKFVLKELTVLQQAVSTHRSFMIQGILVYDECHLLMVISGKTSWKS